MFSYLNQPQTPQRAQKVINPHIVQAVETVNRAGQAVFSDLAPHRNVEEQKEDDDIVDLQMEEAKAISKMKSDMVAVPATFAMSSLISSMSKGKAKKKRNKGKNSIVSKTYNTVASRPIARPIYLQQVYVANLRGETVGAFASSTVASVYFSQFFTLTNFAASSEYLGLFDQYRFDEIEYWIEPQQSQSTVLSNQGEFITCVDLDDAAAPTNIATVEGKQSSLLSGGLDGHYHKWVPHMAVATYSGAFTSFSNAPPMWIDSGSPNVQHYGIKGAITATNAVITYNASWRAKISFRQAGI